MKILISGGAGFIGSNLANTLCRLGHSVTILDNLSPQIHGDEPLVSSPLFKSLLKEINFIKGDVTSRSDWERAISDNEVIVHFAAETGTGQSMYEINKYTSVNIGGTAILLDIITNNKIKLKKIVVASSRAIYGEGKYYDEKLGVVYPEARLVANMDSGNFEVTYKNSSGQLQLLPTDEDSKLHPTSVYGITKQVQEQMVMTVCNSLNIPAVAFRYQNVYGPGQSLTNPYTGILSIFSTRILNGNSINIFEDGDESRDFVFIDDVIRATILGIEKDEANGQVFNVGSGEPKKVKEVVTELLKNFNRKVEVFISGNYRVGDIRHNYADLKKISTVLGFVPKVKFEEGIKFFTKWVTEQNLIDDNYDKSIEEIKKKGFYK